MAKIEGLIVATPTPFDENDKINFDYVAKHLNYMQSNGAKGVVPSGTNGEGASMSLAERKELFRNVIENKGDLFVIPGTGCPSLPETIELTQAAEKMGADAALVIPPYFFKNVSLDGLYNYYAAVLKSTSLPVLLYNIPGLSGIEISDQLIDRLAEFPNLLGVKDSSANLERSMKYCWKHPNLNIYVGADVLIEGTANFGVKGILSGLANAFPALIAETMKLCAEGRGTELQKKIARISDIFNSYPLFTSNKYALTFKGFPFAHMRAPMVDLNEEQKAAFAADLRREELI